MAGAPETTCVVHHGWSIGIAPARGGGTTFRVTVPLESRSGLPGHPDYPSVPLPAPLTIRTRTAADARGLHWGLNRELRTGHPDQDSALYIASDAPTGDLIALLASPELRRELMQCVYTERGVLELAAATDAEATLTLSVARSADEPSMQTRRNALAEALAVIASRLPALRPSQRSARPVWAERFLALSIFSTPVAWISTGMLHAKWPLFASWAYYLAVSFLGLVAALGACALMFRLSRGLAHGWFNFKVFVLFALMTGPFAGASVCHFVNCAFDQGPTDTHVVEILEVLSGHNSKTGTHDTFILRSWLPGRETEALPGSTGVRRDPAGSNYAVLRTRPGLLGAQWLVGFGPDPHGR